MKRDFLDERYRQIQAYLFTQAGLMQTITRQFRRLQTGNLARETATAFVMRTAGIFLLFAWLAFLARYVGAQTYGQYMYVFNWLEILALISLFGLNRAALRFVAAYRSQADWGLLQGFIRRTRQVTLLASSLMAVVTAGVVWFLKEQLETGLVPVFWIGLIYLPLMALLQLTSAHLQGLKRVALSLTPNLFRPLFLIIGVLGLVKFLGYQPGAMAILGLEAVVVLLLLFTTRQFLLNIISSSGQPKTYRTREWLVVAVPMLLISLVNIVQSRTDIIMLGIFQGTTAAGYYTSASRVAGFVLFGLTTVNLVMAPLISELFSLQQQAELQRIVTRVAQVVFLFTLPVALSIIVGGRFALQLFGPEFVVAYPALVILTIGQFINALAGPVGYLMTMTRHQNEAAIILIASAGLNIGLNAFLIPNYGLFGAALATVGSMFFWNLAMVVLTQKRLAINPTVFRIKRKTSV